jgi:hypothetical protein
MTIGQTLLPEFDREMANTRRMLEGIPEGKFDWSPHSKSSTLGKLVNHLAVIPGFVAMIVYGKGKRKLFLAFLSGINGKNLILLILIKTQMAVVLNASIGQLARAPDKASLLRSFLAHKQHPGCVSAIRTRVFLLPIPSTGEIRSTSHGPCST